MEMKNQLYEKETNNNQKFNEQFQMENLKCNNRKLSDCIHTALHTSPSKKEEGKKQAKVAYAW